MAAIDYYAIEEAVAAVLNANAGFSATGAKVFIEEDFAHGMSEHGGAVFIYLDRRTAPAGQPIAAGQQTRYHIRLSLWTRFFALESMKKAIEKRDDLLAIVETALMAKRTLNHAGADVVISSWLEGGEMMSAKSAKGPGFLASAETVLVVDKKTTTS